MVGDRSRVVNKSACWLPGTARRAETEEVVNRRQVQGRSTRGRLYHAGIIGDGHSACTAVIQQDVFPQKVLAEEGSIREAGSDERNPAEPSVERVIEGRDVDLRKGTREQSTLP